MASVRFPNQQVVAEYEKLGNKAYKPTQAKIARVAGVVFAGIAVTAALVLSGVFSFGIIPFAALIALAVTGGLGSMVAFLKGYWASRKEEDLTFHDYVTQKCTGFTPEQADKLALLGKHVVTKIEAGSMRINDLDNEQRGILCSLIDSTDHSDKESLKAAILQGNIEEDDLKRILMIPVSWLFIQKAFKSNQGYEKGMIKFEDPGHKIVNFFKPICIERPSTHFKKERESSLGVNIPKGLPYIFKHVHLGALRESENHQGLKKTFSFCKLEEFGWGGCSETAKHCLDCVRMLAGKVLGEADGPNDRKEKRVPKAVKAAFKELCKTIGKPPQKCTTVAEMIKWAEGSGQNIDAFKAVLERQFPGDFYLDYRNGNEAIIAT